VKAGGVAEGGSTLTQQLAKNRFLTASRSPIRKLREASLASMLEVRYSKEEILEAYLNEIYLGQDGGIGIHGVGAASRFYFGKTVGCLTVAESALLAGMIQAPNRIAPTRRAADALKRRNLVLDLMHEQKRIETPSATLAKEAPVSSRSYPLVAIDARYFRDFVSKSTTTESVPDRGTAIYTTLDASLQQSAERAIASGLKRIKLADVEAAFIAIDPYTGEILAMVGGRDYGTSQFNRATEALRQPGSAFKPIVALAALEGGPGGPPPFTLASILEDEPLSVGSWTPTNYDGTFRGPVTLRHALEQSLNIPFARIGISVGPGRIASTAQRLGIKSKLDPVPSLALGSSEVTLLEMVRAYGVFATQGNLADTRWVLSWRDHNDTTRDGPRPYITEVANPGATFLVTSALQGVVQRGTGRALSAGRVKGDVAGKTGTSNNWRDAWFIAYSPNIVVGAWVGYDDGRSVRLSGGAAAVPIVAEFFRNAQRIGGNSFRIPNGIERSLVYTIDWWPCGQHEYFLRGTAPPSYETVAQLIALRSDTTAATDSLGTPGMCAVDRTER
jgi:penicillin-binding protein 1B